MIKKTNINDVEETFAKLDFALICEDEYNTLKQIDWVIFSILKNQEGLSKNSYQKGNKSYVDSNGNVFIRISQEKLAKLLKISIPTLRASLKRLAKVYLIESITTGVNQCNKIYVGTPNRSITFAEYISKIGIELDGEVEEYEPNINVTNINKDNKKVASTENTNNLGESNNDSTNSIINNITQRNVTCNTKYNEIKQDTHVNIKLLKSSGISFVPYKKEKEKILNMDTEKLKVAIEITIQKSNSKTWNYLVSTYENLNNMNYKQESIVINNKFANFTQTIDQYSDDELDAIIEKSQRVKFG